MEGACMLKDQILKKTRTLLFPDYFFGGVLKVELLASQTSRNRRNIAAFSNRKVQNRRLCCKHRQKITDNKNRRKIAAFLGVTNIAFRFFKIAAFLGQAKVEIENVKRDWSFWGPRTSKRSLRKQFHLDACPSPALKPQLHSARHARPCDRILKHWLKARCRRSGSFTSSADANPYPPYWGGGCSPPSLIWKI